MGLQSGVTFLKKWGYKTPAKPPPCGDSNNPKSGGLMQETDTLRTTFESPFLA